MPLSLLSATPNQCPYYELRLGFTGRRLPALAADIIDKLPKSDDPGNFLLMVLTSKIRATGGRFTRNQLFRISESPTIFVKLINRLVSANKLTPKHLSAIHQGSSEMELSLAEVLKLKGILNGIKGAEDQVNEIFRSEPWGSFQWKVEGDNVVLSANARRMIESHKSFALLPTGYLSPKENLHVPISASDYERIVYYLEHLASRGQRLPLRVWQLRENSQRFHLRPEQIRRLESTIPIFKDERRIWGLEPVNKEIGDLLANVEGMLAADMSRDEALSQLPLTEDNFMPFVKSYVSRDFFRPEDFGVLSEMSRSMLLSPIALLDLCVTLRGLPSYSPKGIFRAAKGTFWGKHHWVLRNHRDASPRLEVAAVGSKVHRLAEKMKDRLWWKEKRPGRTDNPRMLIDTLIENLKGFTADDYVQLSHALLKHLDKKHLWIFNIFIGKTHRMFNLHPHHREAMERHLKEHFPDESQTLDIEEVTPLSRVAQGILERLENADATALPGMLSSSLKGISTNNFVAVVTKFLVRQNGKNSDLEVIRRASLKHDLSYLQLMSIYKVAIEDWVPMGPVEIMSMKKLFVKAWGQFRVRLRLKDGKILLEGHVKNVFYQTLDLGLNFTMSRGEGSWIDAETYTQLFVAHLLQGSFIKSESKLFKLARIARRFSLSPEQLINIREAIEYAHFNYGFNPRLAREVWLNMKDETKTAMESLSKVSKKQRTQKVARILKKFTADTNGHALVELVDLSLRKELLQPSDFGTIATLMRSARINNVNTRQDLQAVALGIYPHTTRKQMRALLPESLWDGAVTIIMDSQGN